jgi:hypothetical protein
VRDPPHDLVPELPRSLSDAAERFAALHRRGQHGELLVLGDAEPSHRDRPVPGAQRHHPDLVRARFGADLRSPQLRVDIVRGADLSAGQQLRIVAAGTVKVVIGDPPKPLVMLRLHAAFS